MLVQQVIVLCNIPVVKIGNTEIKQNVKQKRKIKYREIKTIFTGSSNILHSSVDAKYPERLNQQIKKKQKPKIGNKFTPHVLCV
jgi:ATP-dependent protease HslVU (ClpYQ) peptidase subunit